MGESGELTIALLGAPLMAIDGAPLTVDTRKATALLAYLAVTDRPVRRDVLTGLFWPEADPERARSALRRTLSTLRTALGGRWLTIDRETVALDRDGVWLDVAELRGQIASCATHGHALGETCPRCLAPLEAAVALDRGRFLEGFGLRDSAEFDDWQQLTTEELRREVAVALDRLAALLGARGDHPAAIAVARRRLALDPLHEPAHRELIRLLADAGDRASALEQYRECVRTLDRELGVRPLDETTALYHAILEGAHTPAAQIEPLREPESGVEARYALVGRDREVDVVRRSFESVGPDGRLLAIVGEAGIGKTRLCDELASIARERGSRAATVRCFQEEAGLAFGVVMQLVRAALETTDGDATTGAWWRPEAARLLPELGAPPTTPLDSLAAQARFYEAICALVTECVCAQGTGVVVVDDIHWADEASLGLLGYLVNRLRGRPLLVALTWRPEEGASAHAIQGLLSDARRGRSARLLPLGRLSQAEVGVLVRLAGQDEGLASQLHRESGGLPFFVVEYLDALARGEDLTGDWPMPGGVRELLGCPRRRARRARRPGRHRGRGAGTVVRPGHRPGHERPLRRRDGHRARGARRTRPAARGERRHVRLPPRAGARSRRMAR